MHRAGTIETQATNVLPSDLIAERHLAQRWQKSLRTLQRWRVAGDGPPFLRLGGSIFYHADDIRAFEAARKQVAGAPK